MVCRVERGTAEGTSRKCDCEVAGQLSASEGATGTGASQVVTVRTDR